MIPRTETQEGQRVRLVSTTTVLPICLVIQPEEPDGKRRPASWFGIMNWTQREIWLRYYVAYNGPSWIRIHGWRTRHVQHMLPTFQILQKLNETRLL
jgi:hypothetical protein